MQLTLVTQKNERDQTPHVVVLADRGHKEWSCFNQAHKILPHIEKRQKKKDQWEKNPFCVYPSGCPYKRKTKFEAGKDIELKV
jgi:hypothetical protein